MPWISKLTASGSKSGGVCKCKRHKLQHCPLIKKSELLTVRRQYAAFCGFCFNFALKSLGMVVDRGLNRILTRFRMVVVLTHPTTRSPSTKVTCIRLPPISLVTIEWIKVKLRVLNQTNYTWKNTHFVCRFVYHRNTSFDKRCNSHYHRGKW